MSAKHEHHEHSHQGEYGRIQEIAEATRQGLIFVILILLAIMAVLFFKIGGFFWPAWLIEYRIALMVVNSFIIVSLTLLSPIIIEANSNPRPLSGPGTGRGGSWGGRS